MLPCYRRQEVNGDYGAHELQQSNAPFLERRLDLVKLVEVRTAYQEERAAQSARGVSTAVP